MADFRPNSSRDMALGRQIHWHYGSWEAARRAGKLMPSGGWAVLSPPADCECGCQTIKIPDEPVKKKGWFS